MTAVDILQILEDKYTAEELVEKLGLEVSAIVNAFEEEILEQFNEDGVLQDEWRDFYGQE